MRMQTEDPVIPRGSVLKIVTGSGVLAALGDLGFLTQLPSVFAAEAALEPRMARFHPDWTTGASSRLCSCACVP